jgi:hypothetical protein
MKMFLINNGPTEKNPPIGKRFQEALKREGFIEEIDKMTGSIEVSGSSVGNETLQQIVLTGLDELSSIQKIWKINLEQEIEGISTKGKTTEIALLVLHQISENTYRLVCLLIELKSSLQSTIKNHKIKNTFQDIEDKFIATMNRIYMLLTINNHSNIEKGYSTTTIYVVFKGIICYNKLNIKETQVADRCKLYLLFKNGSHHLTCKTILHDKDKIQVKFFQNPHLMNNSQSFEIALKDMMTLHRDD